MATNTEEGDEEKIRSHLLKAINEGQIQRDSFDLNPILSSLQTAKLVIEEIGLRRDAVLAIMLRPIVEQGHLTIEHREELRRLSCPYPAWIVTHPGTLSEESCI